MAKWRMKSMGVDEWAPLQDRFGELQIASGGDPDLAMFMKRETGSARTEIYLTGPNIEVIEQLSPGGWRDSDAPSGKGVGLLVGANDPWERFGIKQER